MARPIVLASFSLALLAFALWAPATAQVINGETPLDETTLNRETPGPAEQPQATPAQPPPPATDPARVDPPRTAPRRD